MTSTSGALARLFALASLSSAPLLAQTQPASTDLGGGTPGVTGLPTLTVEGSPIVGNPLRLQVTNAAPLEHGCVGFSTVATPVPLPFFGATVHPGFPLFGLKLFTTDELGRSPLVLNVPSVGAHLVGATFVVQGMIDDSVGAGGSTFTNGRRLTLGLDPAYPDFALELFPTIGQSDDMALGDLDEDGKLDVVIASTFGGLSVLRGRGDGSFEAAAVVLTDADPIAVELIDIDDDGHLDAIVGDSEGKDVLVLMGAGDGTFAAPVPFSVPGPFGGFELVDLDGDSILDLVVPVRPQDRIVIRLATAPGVFGPLVDHPVGDAPEGVVAADLNGDGDMDLLVRNEGSDDVSVLMGRGDGTFLTAPSIDVGTVPSSLDVGDADGDGVVDVLIGVLTFPLPAASIWRGKGTGLFEGPELISEEIGGRVRFEDFDGDGSLDVVGTGFANGDGIVSVALGDGSGGYEPAHTALTHRGVAAFAVGDLNADDLNDFVLGEFGAAGLADLSVVMGRADGGLFGGSAAIALPVEPRGMATGDVDLDGIADVIVACIATPDGAALVRGSVAGPTGPAEPIAGGEFCTDVDLADFDEDGALDLVLTAPDDDALRVLLGDGAGNFGAFVEFPCGDDPRSVVAFDVDADGHVDLIAANDDADAVAVLFGAGDGTFGAPLSTPVGSDPNGIAVGDVTGDGFADVVVTRPNADSCIVLEGGAGAFVAGQVVSVPNDPGHAVLADLDHDGDLDLLVLCREHVAVRFQIAGGSFDAGYDIALGHTTNNGPNSIDVADLNGDGDMDFVIVGPRFVGSNLGETIAIHYGDGAGQFGDVRRHRLGALPTVLALEDVDGDGFPDVLSADRDRDALVMLRNQLVRGATTVD